MTLPMALYRGDQDAHGVRNLRGCWNRGWLQTNLGSGGRGSDLFRSPLVKLVEQHVNGEWPQTHFLSFSSDRRIAESFARGTTGKSLHALSEDVQEWDTAILTLNCQRLTVRRTNGPGFFVCSYNHLAQPMTSMSMEAISRLIQDSYHQNSQVPVLLIDVLTALNALETKDDAIREARYKAERDHEWLILPLEAFETALTALLDDSCISNREKFRLI